MPAEWEPHAATWLSWPHERSDWPGKFAPIRHVYVEIIRHLAAVEPVRLLVQSKPAEALVRRWLARAHVNLAAVEFVVCPSNRSWIRDSGPIFVRDHAGARCVTDWHFNAWAKYDNWVADDAIPAAVAGRLDVPRVQPRLRSWRVVLEGGSIDVNGQGTLLTTEECLLSKVQERNPPFDRSDYETVFAQYLGVEQVLWLNQGIAGDDTHGHVDEVARFVSPRTIVAAVENHAGDVNYRWLQENWERLQGFRDAAGNRFEIVKLPMPAPLYYEGRRLPASYANFYIANGLVIVPTFNDPADRLALGTLADLFPGRRVIGIHCVDLVWGLGTLHCMTQQEPR